jgi:hypothetical protein
MKPTLTVEEQRLRQSEDRQAHWKRWGPYLSERAWGTVREDYSANGTAWEYFPHNDARSRAYRWNEDGIAGICDRHQYICFALAMWNGRDPILKERLFGLTGNQGNHGEDVKEYYFYLDSTPTHSYMKYLYKYPQAEYPYEKLVTENGRRTKLDPEFELIDSGVFAESRYFDVFVEYAKQTSEDILIEITVANRGPEEAQLTLLPTLWFRNEWSWDPSIAKPSMKKIGSKKNQASIISAKHGYYRERYLYCQGSPDLLFTENETNCERLFNAPSACAFVKDAFHEYVVNSNKAAVNPAQTGTKAAALYELKVPAQSSATVRLRLSDVAPSTMGDPFNSDFEKAFKSRKKEADDFYATVIPKELSDDAKNVMRQSLAGMLWSKQFYHYELKRWLDGDPGQPPPPPERKRGRNHEWTHLYNSDVVSMPDKWEYPWYAAWDLAFHCITLALVDSDFAKEQLILMLREWYMHPNGQLPAYEWAFGDVNPPVHAWAAWRVYKIEKKRRGVGDRAFLERVFHKLMLNFTWWVNRKDAEGNNIFQGGFLGLDNIGVFDRSAPLPTGGFIEQSDGTSWMAMYTLNLLAIALELAAENPAYEDVASKFWEHFLYIAYAMNHRGHGDGNEEDGVGMWDETDGFFYDVLHTPETGHQPMRVRSMVGLIPLFAVETLEPELLERLPGFKRRLEWFVQNRPELTSGIASMHKRGQGERRLLSIVDAAKLRRIMQIMLDEKEFFSPYGIRALSRVHKDHPFTLKLAGAEHSVDYEPGESTSGLFGGNSNWRGPIWFPVNFLLIESLQKFDFYLGDDFKVECPVGSGKMLTLHEVAAKISRRLSRIFLRGWDGTRPVNGTNEIFQNDPHWRDLIQFYEYFNGDVGSGVGANHQTGWTGLVAKLLQQSGDPQKHEDAEELERHTRRKTVGRTT